MKRNINQEWDNILSRMREYIQIIVLVLLLLSIVVPVDAAEKAKIIEIDLFSAIELALENDLDLQIAELNHANARIQYQKSKAANMLNQSRYSELEAEYNLLQAEDKYIKTRNGVVNNAIQQYTSLILAGMDLEVKEKLLELQGRLLNEVRSQVAMGEKSELDLLRQESTYNRARNELEEARDNYRKTLREIKGLLGISREYSLHLPEGLKQPEVWEIEEAQALEKAMENSRSLKLAEMKFELSKLDKERAEVSTISELDQEMVKNNLKIAELQVEKAREDLVDNVQQQYFAFKQAVNVLEVNIENLAVAREEHEIIKEQKEAGLKTENDLLQAEINLLQAEYQYQSALAGYYLQEQALRQVIGLDEVVRAGEEE